MEPSKIFFEHLGIPVPNHLISANKSLGQHFMIDREVVDNMVASCGDLYGEKVVEIGPGLGMLTASILRAKPAQVILIEKDKRFNEHLPKLISHHPEVISEVIWEDALKVDVSGPCHIIANLPYNISTVLLFKWLEDLSQFKSITVMMQMEVIKRIIAKHNSKSYGWMSIFSQIFCDIDLIYDLIPPKAFWPAPKVDSAIIKLTPKKSVPDKKIIDCMALLCKKTMLNRRKMLRNTIKTIGPDRPWDQILEGCGISGQMRPEDVSIEKWIALAESYLSSL